MMGRLCANCCKDLLAVPEWYLDYAGRIHFFCSQRCHDRFKADPAGRVIVSPLRDVESSNL